MVQSLPEILLDKKIIVIMRGTTGEKALRAAEAVAEGGLSFLEVAFDPSGCIPVEETAATVEKLKREFAGRLHIGVGTVVSTELVDIAYCAGAGYVIAPNTDEEVISRTKQKGMMSIPGALTPTEIERAHKAGADFVKIFPMENMGAEYIKAVKSSLNHVRYVAVGGIKTENIKTFLEAGAVAFGIGSNILDKKTIERGDYKKITDLARTYAALVG